MFERFIKLFSNDKKEPEIQASKTRTPVIDQSVVAQLKELSDSDFILSLYQDFEKEATDLIQQISDLTVAGKAQECLSPLHQLKGTSGTLGLKVLYSHIRDMEQELKAEHYSALPQHLKELKNHFQEYRTSYLSELQHLKS